jgi:hypothetical protein
MPADQNAPFKLGDFGYFRSNFAESRSAEERHRHCTSWAQGMFSLVSKSLLACVIASFALLSSGQARAQTGGTGGTISGTGGTTTSLLTAANFTMYFESWDAGQGQWVQMNSTTQAAYFFNQARCLCGEDQNAEFKVVIETGTGVYQQITNLLSTTNSFPGGQGVGYLFAGKQGTDCLVANTIDVGSNLAAYCTNLEDPNSTYPGNGFTMSELANSGHYESAAIPVARLFGAYVGCNSSQGCDSTSNCTLSDPINIQFWAQTQAGSSPDFDGQVSGAAISMAANVQAVPTNVIVQGGNEALSVSWGWLSTVSISTDNTLNGVQIFCRRGASNYVYADNTFGAAYLIPSYRTSTGAAAGVCPATAPAQPTNVDPLTLEAPLYLCSGLIAPTTQSYRITGLQNGITYGVAIAAVDKYQNIGPLSNIFYQTPVPTVDFYSDYRKDGGVAPGGFCALAGWQKRGSALVTIGMVGLALIAVRRRRWKRRPPGSGGLAILFVTGALAASADPARAEAVYPERTSYGDLEDSEPWNGSPREFAIEARFGLYTPNVDSEFSGQPPPPGSKTPPQPNALVFGTQKRPMWQFEFDWEFLHEFGTLSIGGSIGYYKENASACNLSDWSPTNCTRSSADNTALRLIPLAALLIYRMDEASEQWHIPIVPYGKIGLNYTIWTVTDGNGNVPNYAGGGHGQGGTPGWQAAVGLSLCLDFLDPGAARGFDADSGVNHSYAFFELDHMDGSGLYRKDVLRVGDNTWFTGLMFEF